MLIFKKNKVLKFTNVPKFEVYKDQSLKWYLIYQKRLPGSTAKTLQKYLCFLKKFYIII